ncbi:class I SAM-dependent DNA methyltransferase [Clostridium folliculivorans]|uniref:S-adenosylmethionine-dependent methyltransferase n=1 Tax=Clostridium folliculivorans TaxID=2886038 RepID=A0A9W5XZL1_9CLOT|nr:class I SAM-dependent methyltransferase [Clostridium folliculivorans]GKU23893.1 S-adenosylmethionine-dependent methyltransferase [Clostridium folliculivorans]GKU30009.1 S-adenosylmethionine-dependent methyltransferase [Clostridium folliculivorans]
MDSYNKFANLYDQLIYEDINYNSISDFILNLCKDNNINYEYYLDLACGTGNVAAILGKNFKNIFLVDSSDSMLINADKKFRDERMKCKIVCQDMSELSLNRKFDLVTCVLDSTNYILDTEDLKNYFLSVKRHMSENGIFVFDINSYYKLSEILGNNIFTYNSEEIFYTWENIFEDEIVEMNLTFFVKEGDLYERFEEIHEERAYKEDFIESMVKDAGFEIIGKYDGYKNSGVEQDSERIVYVLKNLEVN